MLKSIRRKLHLDNYKLETVAKACNIEISNLHRALADCELIYRINNKLNIFWNNVSINTHYFMIFLVYSPHTRGWTYTPLKQINYTSIFPAYAGVNLLRLFFTMMRYNIPRIRGGEPGWVDGIKDTVLYSPHTRGWTCNRHACLLVLVIFPAYAGVNLTEHETYKSTLNIPRIRGGEPKMHYILSCLTTYSPHTRGWT